MSVQLWSHQEATVNTTIDAIISGRRSGLWVMPTGTGKTLAFLNLARQLAVPTLILTHRDELIRQVVHSASQAWPQATVGVIQGERNGWQARDLVVASVQSLHAGRLRQIPRDRFGLVIADECHHVPAPSWSQVIDYFEALFLLGVTATPDRLDGQGLAKWFGPEPLHVYPLQQAVAEGILVPIRQLAINTDISLDEVSVRGGDFAVGDLASVVAVAARNQVVVEAYRALASGRKAIAFAVDRQHVRKLTATFRKAGIRAVGVTSNLPMDERRRIFDDFAAGKYAVLVNCEICTEGYDDREVNCIIMARPTQSRALYQQCVGRGLRTCARTGKQDCLVLDITDNCRKHKLVTAADLFGNSEPAADAGRSAGQHDADVDADAALVDTVPDLDFGPVCPVVWVCQEVAPWPELPTLRGYGPTAWWHDEPATERQVYALRRFGMYVRNPLTKGQASYLLNQCIDFAGREPATPRQEYVLQRLDAWEPGLTRRQAAERIDRIMAEPSA